MDEVQSTMELVDELIEDGELEVMTDRNAERERKKSKEQQHREEALLALAKLGGMLTSEDDVVFEGTKLVIPETMNVKQAIRMLAKKLKADEEEISFSRTFRYRPWDGALAARNAIFKAFGVVQQKATFSFFGKNPPQLLTINVGPDETEQIPWGAVEIPHLPGVTLYFEGYHDPEMGNLFHISVESPRKYRHHVEGIFRLIEDELKMNSMYRGKAFDGQSMPQFLDLSGISREEVIYSDDVMIQLEANVWSLLRHTQQMEDLGVPLKRAVLLEGPYGTGKTLAAYLTAQEAVANGWTFIYCRPGKDDLETAMRTAQLYQPAVVFFEDIDTETDGEADATRMLDVFDGIAAKGTKIIGVLTTNHKERIHKGMVRPGRLDAVIHIGALDQGGVERMTRVKIPNDRLAEDIDFTKVYEAMDGFMPAFCSEAIDRAVRYSLARNAGELKAITTDDLVDAATGLRPQLELMEGANDRVAKPDITEMIAGKVLESFPGALKLNGEDLTFTEVGEKS